MHFITHAKKKIIWQRDRFRRFTRFHFPNPTVDTVSGPFSYDFFFLKGKCQIYMNYISMVFIYLHDNSVHTVTRNVRNVERERMFVENFLLIQTESHIGMWSITKKYTFT